MKTKYVILGVAVLVLLLASVLLLGRTMIPSAPEDNDVNDEDPGFVPIPDPDSRPGPVEPSLDLPRVVARIGDEEIKGSRIELIRTDLSAAGMMVSAEEIILNMVAQKVLAREAENQGYNVSDEQVENMIEAQGVTDENLERHNITREEYFQEQRDVALLELYALDLIENITISEEELRDLYEEEKHLFGEGVTFEDAKEYLLYILEGEALNDLLFENFYSLKEQYDVEIFYP